MTDSSPEAVAAMVAPLKALIARFRQDKDGFVLVMEGDGNERDATLIETAFWSNVVPLLPKVSQVATERDEARADLVKFRLSFDGHTYIKDEELSAIVARADTASRQLAEARAALAWIEQRCNDGSNDVLADRETIHAVGRKARALSLRRDPE